MAERNGVKTDQLAQSKALFIRRWGEMAASWGISRTMAEIHALLYISDEPICTDDVMESLQVSRGSASTNLRQLVNWGRGNRLACGHASDGAHHTPDALDLAGDQVCHRSHILRLDKGDDIVRAGDGVGGLNVIVGAQLGDHVSHPAHLGFYQNESSGCQVVTPAPGLSRWRQGQN